MIKRQNKNNGLKKTAACFLALFVILGTTACGQRPENNAAGKALTPKTLPLNRATANPYMGAQDAAIHNDSYSSDVTSSAASLGIDPEVNITLDNESTNSMPCAFYDNAGNAVAPYNGGIAVRELSGERVTVMGSFVPRRDEGQNYGIQSSYAFVDEKNRVVAPASNGHVLMLQTTDADGSILPNFKKLLDVDIAGEARKVLGTDIDTNLLSIIFDYEGNLWFTTGGFRIDPGRYPPGFTGYLSRDYIDAVCAGQSAPAGEHLFFKKLTQGEGAENGISSCPEGAVVLTNKTCYMLKAQNGVAVSWQYSYESRGGQTAEGDFTGQGLAWGSGTTPTLTDDLVLFTDNTDPIHLIALSAKSGAEVAKTPVLDNLPEGTPVSVENSILVYSGDESRTSVLVCNWYGAGNPKLLSPDSDSSIQTYDNIYNPDWISGGNSAIAPGVERVDIVKKGEAYGAEKKWTRGDIRDTSMIKLSTATGYLYGYWQDMDTGMWGFNTLDFDTGETLQTSPVSSLPEYNNMAVGVILDPSGNNLICPTNNKDLVRLQDRFVYLPELPAEKLDLDKTGRKALTDEAFQKMSGSGQTPATLLSTACVSNQVGPVTIAFKVNGLSGKPEDLTLYTAAAGGALTAVDVGGWTLTDGQGSVIDKGRALEPGTVYEVRFQIQDQSESDLDQAEREIKVEMVLGH